MENYRPDYSKAKGGLKFRHILIIILLAIVAGGALAVWAAQKYSLLPGQSGGQVNNGQISGESASADIAPNLLPDGSNVGLGLPVSPQSGAAALGTAIATGQDLDAQLSRINTAAAVATGNAARAEGMLLALAARRAIDSGASLGYAEEQLQNRFGISNPRQVAAIVQAARNPVTIEILRAEMAAQGGEWLAPGGQSLWSRIQNEAGELFVLRKETTLSPAPTRRLERARFSIEAGNIDAAIAEVEKLPGAKQATGWLARARGLSGVRKALDTIERAALAPSARPQPPALVVPAPNLLPSAAVTRPVARPATPPGEPVPAERFPE